jgi:hypothetical protein
MALIEGAKDDIDHVLSSRKKLPVVSGMATPIKTQTKTKTKTKSLSKANSKMNTPKSGASLAQNH